MSQQYYILQPGSEQSHGPYTIAQLQSFAETGRVSKDTLYYDNDDEGWVPIKEDDLLRETIFPQKQKLQLKSTAPPQASTQPPTPARPTTPDISVEEMLNTATNLANPKSSHLLRQKKGGGWAAPMVALGLLLSGIAFLNADMKTVKTILSTSRYTMIFSYPLIMLGVFDIIISFFYFLGVERATYLVRWRILIGLGYFGYIYWAFQDTNLLYSVVAGCMGAFFVTLEIGFQLSFFSGLISLIGMGSFAYFYAFAR